MSRTLTCAIVIGAIAFWGTWAEAQSLPLLNRAKQTLQAFIGADLEDLRIGNPKFTRHGIWVSVVARGYGKWSDPTKLDSYDIDVRTGEVTGMLRLSFMRPQDVEPRLTEDECQEIGLKFVQRRYSGFQQLPMRFIGSGLSGNEDKFMFVWRQVLNAHGTLAPHHISLEVDRATGEVVYYAGWHPVITGPTVPRITRGQAERTASFLVPPDIGPDARVETTLEMWPDEVGVQSLFWRVWHRRLNDAGEELAGSLVDVDALTGVVLGRSRSLGAPTAPPPPASANLRFRTLPNVWLDGRPLDLSLGSFREQGRSFVPVETAQLFGWTLHRAAGARSAVLERDGRRVVVVAPPSPDAESAVRVRDGRLFVATRWLATLSGAGVRWEAVQRRVHLTSTRGR